VALDILLVLIATVTIMLSWCNRLEAKDLFVIPHYKVLQDPQDKRILEKEACSRIGLTGVPWDWSTGGDPGARHTPRLLRDNIYASPDYSPSKGQLTCKPKDYGDIILYPRDWEKTKRAIREASRKLFEENKFTIFLGGDHSITGPILGGLLDVYDCVGLVMLDAHFDLRSISGGVTSGSWLYDLYQEQRDRIKTVIIGIGEYSNPSYLANRAKELEIRFHGVRDVWFRIEEIYKDLEDLKETCPIHYVTLDIDHLDSAYAPGVNSPSSPGLHPRETIQILDYVLDNMNVKGADIVEIVPIKDNGGKTIRLASKLALYMLHGVIS